MARGTIGKRGNTYYIRFYDLSSKQRWESGFRTKKQAESALAERLSQTNIGRHIPKGDIRISELANRWLELKKAVVRPKVYASYKSNVRRFIDNFGELKVKNASPEDLEQFIASLKLAPATINRQITIIKAIFEKAIEWNYLSVSPARFLKRQKVTSKEIEVLTIEEMQKLVESADKRYQSLILTACYTGMRLSEILALRWSDCDFNSNTLFVRQVLQNGKFFEPKTDTSRRAIAIPKFLVEALKVHQAEQAVNLKANEHDLVFTTIDGDLIDGVWFSKCVFTPALKRAGIHKVNFHALRHSYVSMLLAQGENIKFISKQVGHASAKMTLDIYTHLLPDTEVKAMQRLEENCTHFALVASQKVRNETK